jgi:hypothetical protein
VTDAIPFGCTINVGATAGLSSGRRQPYRGNAIALSLAAEHELFTHRS